MVEKLIWVIPDPCRSIASGQDRLLTPNMTRDIPAPPNLVTVERDGIKVDAVAQVTKIGNTLLLDRVTGRPLYEVPLRRVDTKGLLGEVPSPVQPFPELPRPFSRSSFTQCCQSAYS